MARDYIIAVNKNGVTGQFSKKTWDIVKNKQGWIELGDSKKVEIPDDVKEIMRKNEMVDVVKATPKVVNIPKAVKTTKDEITVTEITQLPSDHIPIPISEMELPKKELTRLMIKELKDAGVKIHHLTGYDNAKKTYDDFKEQQNG